MTDLLDDLDKSIRDYEMYNAMTNRQLADALMLGPWAEEKLFSQFSTLLEVIIERLEKEE